MATPGGGKKGKKKKGQTISLNAFLGDSPSQAPTRPSKSSDNWGDDEDLAPVDLAEEYGGPPKPTIDLRQLPSAPRASRGLDVDLSKLPSKPPYTAFLGNLPFDTSVEDIEQLFRGLRVENIRFPQDLGRMKGFGYAEFFDLDQLKAALALTGEKIRNRQVRIDIAEQSGKDQRDGGGGYSRGGFSGGMDDDRTDGDWRSGGGNDGPPPQRYGDDRRGGPGGFDRRGPPRDDDRPPRPLGAADQDDCWRKEAPANAPSTNGWGDRGGRRDDGGGAWGRRGGGGFDDRGPRDGGFRDDRGPRDGGFRDDRGPRDGGFRDDRGPRDGGFRDDRGPRDGGFRDDRGPRDGGFRDDRGPRDGGFRDDRGPRDGGFRDDRGPRDGGFRNDRGPRDGGFRDDRGPRDGGFRNDRGPRDSGFRDDRGPRDGGFRNDRGPPPDNDDGGGWRNDRGPAPERRAPDIVQSTDETRERPKLNLQPRTAETENKGKTPTSSIFGGARPVDTAAKERQIEEKLSKSPHRDNRDKSRDNRDRDQDGENRGPPKGDSENNGVNDDDTAENWRDESLRTDKTRVMRPDLILEAEKGGREGRGDNRGGRGRGRGRGRSNERKKPTKDPKDVVPLKYEEPAKVSFGQSSKFALLADDDDEFDGNESNEESKVEAPSTISS